jgi:hypothetical protein
MADTIAHYLDSIETGRFPDLGLHSPMYLIASKDMDGDWNNTGGQRPTKRICEYGDTIYEELPVGRFMLGVGRITSRSDAYAKCGSNDQDAFVTGLGCWLCSARKRLAATHRWRGRRDRSPWVREAELSNAAESLAIERSDLPVGIAKGALLPPRIVAKDIGSVSYRVGHAPTQHVLVSGLSAASAKLASKMRKSFPFYQTWRLVRNPVATATASVSGRAAVLSRASTKTTPEAALQTVT